MRRRTTVRWVAVVAVALAMVGVNGGAAHAAPRVDPPPAYAPFASWDAFVARQLKDFQGSSGTVSSRALAVLALADGSPTPAEYIDSLVDGSYYGPHMAPVSRLYWAYFRRIPDYGGVTYWTAKNRDGTKLAQVSSKFAGSSEFTTTYGALSNAQFVGLVYYNVLDRPGDTGGVAYWRGQLDRGFRTRGDVMVGFSESNEYVTKMASSVRTVLVYAGLLHRAPTTNELSSGKGLTSQALIEKLRTSAEYAALVT